MGITAVRRHKPHVAAALRRPSLFQKISSVLGKTKNHQQIPPVRLEPVDKVEEKGIAQFNTAFGNVATQPTSRASAGTLLLDEDGYKLCYNVVALSFTAVQLFECISAVYSRSFEDPKPPAGSPSHQCNGSDVNVKDQVTSCAGSGPPVQGHKRQGSGGGVGGSEPKKQRPNGRGHDRDPYYNDNNYNNADDGHDDSDGGSDDNDAAQKPKRKRTSKKKFACPFYKLSPGQFTECGHLTLTTWDRVVQHLSRQHLLKGPYCPNCRISFQDGEETQRDEHVRQRKCQEASAKKSRFILPAEYNKLKKLGRVPDEEKYMMGWDRLFPGEPRPESPLFETELDIRHRKAPSVLAKFPEFARLSNARIKEIIDAIFARNSVPTPDPTPLASNPAAMALTPAMTTPLDPALSTAPITAPPAAFSPSKRPQVPPGMHAKSVAGQRINVDTPTMHHTSLQVGEHGQPSSGRTMNAPAGPHPLTQAHVSPSVGHGPRGSDLTTGQSIPALPDEVLPYSSESSAGQQNFLDQFQALSGPMHDMFGNPIWDWGTFANAGMGIGPGGGGNEDEDELNRFSTFGNSSGFDFNYPAPGSKPMG